MKKARMLSTMVVSTIGLGCAHVRPLPTVIPSLEYAKQFSSDVAGSQTARAAAAAAGTSPQLFAQPASTGKASVRLAADGTPSVQGGPTDAIVTNQDQEYGLEDVSVHRSSAPLTRDYTGPLSVGDPGVGASLWKESRGSNDMFRDDRAWLPGDLLTIVVEEKDSGSRQAKTDTKSESTLEVALSKFFGVEAFNEDANPSIDPTALINGSTKNEFKGEGKTDRKNSLTAKISAMVAEVLPTGILRIEGKKIVAVNDEEQIMIISGLVRTRDIASTNEISSAKIANMRIDYYGKGTVDEAQRPGWGSRLVKVIWPF